VKQGEPTNIRPIKWYDNDRTKFKPFNNATEFVKAFDSTQRQWSRTSRDAETSTWLKNVVKGYKTSTGRDLI
jgi:type II restriction enzyme